MPDITMCASETCHMRKTCYRNPESGTKPNEFRQLWFFVHHIKDGTCEYYWPIVVQS